MGNAHFDTANSQTLDEQRREESLSPGQRRWSSTVGVLLLATIYGLTTPGNRAEADDAFGFAYNVEHKSLRGLLGSEHSGHLLFLPIARALLALSHAVGFPAGSYDLIRFTNCLLAALSVFLLRSLLQRRFDLSPFAATSGAAGLAVSYGFWRYACELEVYAAAILLILVLCHLGFSQLTSRWLTLLAALVAALAVLVHILGVVPAVVIVPLTLLLRRRVKEALIYGAAMIMNLGCLGLAAYEYAATPQQGLAEYALSPDPGARYSWSSVPQSVVALGENVANANFLFAYTSVADKLDQAFPAQYLDEERFAGAHADVIARTVPALTALLLFLLAATLMSSLRRRAPPVHRRQTDDIQRLLVVAVWIGMYWFFLVGRSPGAPEAWIPILPALWTAIAATVFQPASRSRETRILTVALLATLLLHNFVGGYWMFRSKSSDLNAARTSWLLHRARAEDVILTADGPVFFRYLRYNSRAQVIDLEGLSPAEMMKAYDAATHPPGHVFATEGVFNPPRPLRLSDKAQDIDRFAGEVRPDFAKVGGIGRWNIYVRVDGAARRAAAPRRS